MKKANTSRILVLMAFLASFVLGACSHVPSEKAPVPVPPEREVTVADPKHFVEDMLVSKGHKRTHVRTLLGDPRISINTAIITKNVFDSAPKASAKNPTVMEVNPRFFRKGIDFIVEHEDAFKAAWERYEVSPEVITAILIIETRLGDYPMKYNVFRVYTTLATLLDSEYFVSVLQASRSGYVPTDEVINSARAKGKWGLEELSALIQLSDRLGIDPISINGSFAGALGPAQFIPTSFVKFGVDGNDDGKIDPFDMEDCIASIANYLKLAGWKEDAALERQRKAIWIYNHHEVYVNTIMMLYDRLIAEGEKYSGEDRQIENTPAGGKDPGTDQGALGSGNGSLQNGKPQGSDLGKDVTVPKVP